VLSDGQQIVADEDENGDFPGIECNKIFGMTNNWILLGFGLDTEQGSFRIGVAGADLTGRSYCESKVAESVTILQDPDNERKKLWKDVDSDFQFGGEIEPATGQARGVIYKLKKWSMLNYWSKGEQWETALTAWGVTSKVADFTVNEEDLWRLGNPTIH
jgi:hypothetical protein